MSAVSKNELDESWNQYRNKPQEETNLILCECVATSQSEKQITPNDKSKPVLVCSFVLKLVEVATGEEITAYLPYVKSLKGNATVKPDSKFAKLYRLTIGDNPRKRYSDAKSLAGHFRGYEFLVSYSIESTAKNGKYRKAEIIKPLNPIIGLGWSSTGKLQPKFKQKTKTKASVKPLGKSGINLGLPLEKSWNNPGKALDSSWIEKPNKPHEHLVSTHVSTTSTSPYAGKQPSTKANKQVHEVKEYKGGTDIIEQDTAKYTTTVTKTNLGEVLYEYHQRPAELEDDYLNRVINESF